MGIHLIKSLAELNYSQVIFPNKALWAPWYVWKHHEIDVLCY